MFNYYVYFTAVVEVYFTKRNEVATLFAVGKYIFSKKIRTFLWHDIHCGYFIDLFVHELVETFL